MIALGVGIAAALVSVASFLPQAWHVIVTPMWLMKVIDRGS